MAEALAHFSYFVPVLLMVTVNVFPHSAQKICCLVNTLEVALNYFSLIISLQVKLLITQHQQQNAQMFLLQAFKDPKYLCV